MDSKSTGSKPTDSSCKGRATTGYSSKAQGLAAPGSGSSSTTQWQQQQNEYGYDNNGTPHASGLD